MSPFRAVPGRVPWKTRPPDARLRAPSLGLAPGRGPGDPRPGEGDSGPIFVFIHVNVQESRKILFHNNFEMTSY